MSELAVDFLANDSWTSRLIEGFGYPRGWSHVASRLESGLYIDSRLDGGVKVRDPANETWARKRTATLQVTPVEYCIWRDNLSSKLGMAYDKSAIEAFMEGRSKHTAATYICSALAVNAIQHLSRAWTPDHIGYVPFPLPGVPAHAVSPNSLLLILATAGFTISPVILS